MLIKLFDITPRQICECCVRAVGTGTTTTSPYMLNSRIPTDAGGKVVEQSSSSLSRKCRLGVLRLWPLASRLRSLNAKSTTFGGSDRQVDAGYAL